VDAGGLIKMLKHLWKANKKLSAAGAYFCCAVVAIGWGISADLALAQSAATNCVVAANMLNCQTLNNHEVDWSAFVNAIRQRNERRRLAHEQEVVESVERARREIQDAIIERVRDGDCKGAEDLALFSKNIDLAIKVKDYCGGRGK
jgi:hypothetical protein